MLQKLRHNPYLAILTKLTHLIMVPRVTILQRTDVESKVE